MKKRYRCLGGPRRDPCDWGPTLGKTGPLLANPQENLGVYPINHYTIPASVLVIIDHTQFCQNRSSSFPNSNSFLIYFFPQMCTILYDAKVGAVFMKGNLRRHTDAI